jgi:hypothetical protein
MPDKTPFVINDRRKFTAEGELRPDVPQAEPEHAQPAPAGPHVESHEAKAPIPFPSTGGADAASPEHHEHADEHGHAPAAESAEFSADEQLPPPPTAEQSEQATRAYAATVDRLDTAIRATNPGMERIPEMSFDRLVQSLYMQALMQLGGAIDPNQPARVDILGARQTIDMLTVIAEKTKGNLTEAEDKLTQSALFELRMGFLEITQAIARQAASKGAPGIPGMPLAGGPSIVR